VDLSTRARGALSGPVPVSVVLSDPQRVLKRGIVTARVNASRVVIVAARALGRGERIQASDLREDRIDASSIPRDVTRDLNRLVGLELRRAVRNGTPIRTTWVEAPTLVERGQLVRLVLVRSGLRIEGRGRAVSDGALGERIRVVNTDSRREVMGCVAPDGSIDVDH
jgi:flagella basal body P-ring formation protein FlgA